MIDLRKFAAVSATLSHPFSIKGKETAAALREIADKIEAGDYLVQGAMVISEADRDDFHFDTLVLKLAPKREGRGRAEDLPAVLAKLDTA
jgi:hypothetical protein